MASKSIYIKGSPVGVDESLIRQALGQYGTIVSVTVPESKDFCFVEYEEESEAQAACDAGAAEVDGSQVTIEYRKGPRNGRASRIQHVPTGTSSSIYIRAVEPSVTKDDVAGLFAPYGTVINTQLRDSVNGRRYAFVQFENAEIVSQIVKSGPFTLGGRTIDVEERQSVSRERQPRNRNNDGTERSNDTNKPRRERRDNGDGTSTRTRAPQVVIENSIYIRGFPSTLTEDELSNVFAAFGDIKSVDVHVKKPEHDDEESRAWGFIEYTNSKEADAAINAFTSGTIEIAGSQVTVELRKSTPRSSRSSGRGRVRKHHGGRNDRRSNMRQNDADNNTSSHNNNDHDNDA